MIKTSFFAAPLLAPVLATSFATQAAAKETVGREVAAPPWSTACMTDHGPSECGEPVWVYGSPATVSRYRNAF